jgi:hypothetical protein
MKLDWMYRSLSDWRKRKLKQENFRYLTVLDPRILDDVGLRRRGADHCPDCHWQCAVCRRNLRFGTNGFNVSLDVPL